MLSSFDSITPLGVVILFLPSSFTKQMASDGAQWIANGNEHKREENSGRKKQVQLFSPKDADASVL